MNKFLKGRVYTHDTNKASLQFWCSQCDANKVSTDKPETGKFFMLHGHIYQPCVADVVGEYEPILLALCTSCLEGN